MRPKQVMGDDMTAITGVHAREILDSRGNPTLEVDLFAENGLMSRAAVPSGASVGTREAVELRDGNEDRYLGKGVEKAVKNVNQEISSAIMGIDVEDQTSLDHIMIALDGTENKSRLGANAILGVSLAAMKLAAASAGRSLWRYIAGLRGFSMPLMFMNVLNGGAHADNPIAFQEFMIVPTMKEHFPDSVRVGAEIFHHLKKKLNEKGLSTGVGDEGGFAPNIHTPEEALDLILSAIESAGYKPEDDVLLALDVAASEFYKDGKYDLGQGKLLTSAELVGYYENLVQKYPIISIEDPLSELDWDGWRDASARLNDLVQLVGDDIFVTNPTIFGKAIDESIANAILIKPNQIGTVTETIETVELAHESGYSCMMSHRSGETEDATIAHLAVGLNTRQIKTGSLCRADRTAKYNELLRISEEMIDLGV